ncbi:MAG: ribonuclease HII [Deltaproteobacteria bacterium CG11_big_fil_rev_8_21_14_0_20_45_16]|nr:MAG: ribonuclease HII [Deltaproteobacteria bacterium CG11_big_fil_rev_8_21_14_0_20_45_16]
MSRQKLLKPKASIHSFCSFRIETEIGHDHIVGLDEVGRGPLAGPVVAAAVCFSKAWRDKEDPSLDRITDSKCVRERDRKALSEWIQKNALWTEVVVVDSEEVDRRNILRASLWAFLQCLEEAVKKRRSIDYVLVDGDKEVPGCRIPQRAIIGGDLVSKSIAAASIVAKVYRDNLMENYASEYPQYSFEKHKGYGTKDHWRALEEFGPCAIHRKSFLGRYFRMSQGRAGEERAVRFLKDQGFKILERNWRSKSGELDIVAHRARELHFVEVRFQSKPDLESAFPRSKQKKFVDAAKSYLLKNNGSHGLSTHYDFLAVGPEQIDAHFDVFRF